MLRRIGVDATLHQKHLRVQCFQVLGWAVEPNKEIMKTAEQRQEISYNYVGPRSMCVCQHPGDGVGQDADGEVSTHGGILGHGSCTACECFKFSWQEFLPAFNRAVE